MSNTPVLVDGWLKHTIPLTFQQARYLIFFDEREYSETLFLEMALKLKFNFYN